MAVTSEFIVALNQICSERGIEKESVIEALKTALVSAYKKEMDKPDLENLAVTLDEDAGAFKIVANKVVVGKVEDADTEIAVEDAKAIDDSIEEGDEITLELPSENFSRIAAQTAKQVIIQQIRESEKEAILSEYEDRVGEIFTALMQRMRRGSVVFEIGKAIAYMPQEEQIPGEFYKAGQRYKVLLKEIQDEEDGGQLTVSRSSVDFLKALFEMEVPELESGIIEIMACAREAGSRSKIAVKSNQEGIDPIGSCVGQRGVRIGNIMAELGEEKIDIIEWNDRPDKFVANALSPAKVLSVKIVDNEEEDGYDKTAIVEVDEDQLSLAIGKDGQNVRLAHKLVKMKIDIVGVGGEENEEEGEEDTTKANSSGKEEGEEDTAKAKSSDKEEREENTAEANSSGNEEGEEDTAKAKSSDKEEQGK